MPDQLNYDRMRERMVHEQLAGRDIIDPRVLAALRNVPRHRYVPPQLRDRAYEDGPLPIGNDQTISQPYIVAYMTQALGLHPDDVVLEIGTGSGYQTAVLCEMAQFVYSLERYPDLAERAATMLDKLDYDNVEIHTGDGSQGLPDMAPFDAIIVTAAAPSIPGPLRAQLADGGRLVLPVGNRVQQMLQLVQRRGDAYHVEDLLTVRFVPLYGRYGFPGPDSP